MKTLNLSLILALSISQAACFKQRSADLAAVQPAPKKLEPIRYTGPRESKVQQTTPPPAPTPHARFTQTEDLNTKYNSKLDVLVVMDTSDSMYCDQDKLDKNIDKFTDAFLKKQGRRLDFRIGVVSAWDSVNFKNAQRDCALGELRPVGGRNATNKGSCTANRGKINYVTRETPDLVKTLAATLKLGTEKFIKDDPVLTGPEQEELFSPVMAALSQQMASTNNNFRRAGEAHLAVIIFSDTDDRTPDVTPDQMANYLNSQATGDLSVFSYGVLARYSELLTFERNPSRGLREYPRADMRNCSINPVDPEIRQANSGPFRLREMLQKSNGVGFDLMDRQYGEKLGDIGKTIVRKILRKEIALTHVLDISQPIVVKYGNQTIPKDDTKGWYYDEARQKLVLNGDLDLDYDDNAKLTIEYTPVTIK